MVKLCTTDTTDRQEILSGYTSEGIATIIQSKGLVPLYRYYNSGRFDYFYTTDAPEIGTTISGGVETSGYQSLAGCGLLCSS